MPIFWRFGLVSSVGWSKLTQNGVKCVFVTFLKFLIFRVSDPQAASRSMVKAAASNSNLKVDLVWVKNTIFIIIFWLLLNLGQAGAACHCSISGGQVLHVIVPSCAGYCCCLLWLNLIESVTTFLNSCMI